MPATAITQPAVRVPISGLLAWLLPGLGHIYIGDVRRGLILMITIAVTFWGGVAIGGVADTIDRKERTAWFMAQVCTGAHGLVGLAWSSRFPHDPGRVPAPWLSVETGVIYSGVAGLLNLLAILDVLARAEQRPDSVGAVSDRDRAPDRDPGRRAVPDDRAPPRSLK
jgi:hypothetical protein